MSDVGDRTYKLLTRIHADLGDLKRDLVGNRSRLSSLEQNYAIMLGDLVQIRIELDDSRSDVSLINRRLDLKDA